MLFFLVGFMGSGKTHWGKLWAERLNYNFIDLDGLIEQQTQKTIAEIFEQFGEDYFRNVETKVLHTLSNQQSAIIACGGGTACFNNNMAWMNEHGKTIYLQVSSSTIFNRLVNEKEKRPLVKNLTQLELQNFIEEKINEREHFYLQAQYVLVENNINTETIKKIINA